MKAKNRPKLETLANMICLSRGADPSILHSKSRKEHVLNYKKAFCALAYSQNYSQGDIADFIGYKDHTTVNYHIKNHIALSQTDKLYRGFIRNK